MMYRTKKLKKQSTIVSLYRVVDLLKKKKTTMTKFDPTFGF